MPRISEWFFKAAVVFFIVSMGWGLQMSISGAHTVTGAHAHAGLLGWVSCAVFGAYYALSPSKATGLLAQLNFWIFVPAVAVMTVALYGLLLGQTAVAPLVAIGSIAAFLGVIPFAILVFSR